MLQPRRNPDLRQESVGPEPGAELLVENLDRNGAPVFQVLRQKDRCHTTASQLAVDAIPAGERQRDVVGEISAYGITHIAGCGMLSDDDSLASHGLVRRRDRCGDG